MDGLKAVQTDHRVGIKPVSVPLVRKVGADKYGKHIEPSGLLPDWAIREFITIVPFIDYGECPRGVISYGLTSAGYDLRVGYRFKVFTNARCATVDPKKLDHGAFVDFDVTGHEWKGKIETGPDGVVVSDTRKCLKCEMPGAAVGARDLCDRAGDGPRFVSVPPNCFALAETIEVVHVPRNVCCWCVGKSSLARCGINMNFTPFEPGWWGVVTVEIINATPLPVKIYAGEGIGQAQFFLMSGEPERGYGDKPNSGYQGQQGLTLPAVRND